MITAFLELLSPSISQQFQARTSQRETNGFGQLAWLVRSRTATILGFACLAAIASGCSENPISLRSPSTLETANLTVQVQPQSAPGKFAVSGSADLPQGTELTIIAVRQLQLQNVPLVATEAPPTYSILDYETVTLSGDRWQTTLNLWQVAPDGRYREAWQLQAPELNLAVDAKADVFFLATLAPFNDLAAIEQQLNAENQRFDRQFIQTTSEGNRYLQTGQSLPVALPTGKTDSIAEREEDLNGGWGNRFLELPDLPNERVLAFPDQRQTDAPVRPEEFIY